MDGLFGQLSTHGAGKFSLNERAEDAVDGDAEHRDKQDREEIFRNEAEEYDCENAHKDAPCKRGECAERADAPRKTALYSAESADVDGILFREHADVGCEAVCKAFGEGDGVDDGEGVVCDELSDKERCDRGKRVREHLNDVASSAFFVDLTRHALAFFADREIDREDQAVCGENDEDPRVARADRRCYEDHTCGQRGGDGERPFLQRRENENKGENNANNNIH